jgi:DegV family protein with EDD domain
MRSPRLKILYLNGRRLHRAFLAGGEAVIRDQAYLNRINVFPVPDGDTGTNLASTMRAIAESSRPHLSLRATLRSIADAALNGAQGNSGIIFAQYLHGVSREIEQESRLSTRAFGESIRRAVAYATKAILTPVEGTMITVIRDWAEAVYRKRTETSDFEDLLTACLEVARRSLGETTVKLEALAKAGVVDAGAKGFVDFLEGIHLFIKKGRLRRKTDAPPAVDWDPGPATAPAKDKPLEQRYCTEALLSGRSLDPEAVREVVRRFGKSAVVAGSDEKVRIHVHTNAPAELVQELRAQGEIVQIKVDDIHRQYDAAHRPKSRIAIVTDSGCDLPPEIFDERQIHLIPLIVTIGGQQYLDKLTISPGRFYELLRTPGPRPTTAVPPQQTVHNAFAYLAAHYESLIVITMSEKLTGVYSLCRTVAGLFPGRKISVLDSRGLSATQGLLVARASEAALAGVSHEDIVKSVEAWSARLRFFVDVESMESLIRSGRVSPMKGLIARILNIKPLIVIDGEGRAVENGRSFSRRGNMAKILRKIERLTLAENVWNYTIVHARNRARAEIYAERLAAIVGKPPAYILDVSPVVGVHVGIGAVGIAFLDD